MTDNLNLYRKDTQWVSFFSFSGAAFRRNKNILKSSVAEKRIANHGIIYYNTKGLKGRTSLERQIRKMKIDYSNIIRKKLLREMKAGAFSTCDKLPRELELAKSLG